MPDKIDWADEIRNSIDLNRLKLDTWNKGVEKEINALYLQIFNDIDRETSNLFAKASIEGKWLKSQVIKFNRNVGLMKQITERLRYKQRELKKIIGKHIKNTTTDEYREIQELLNDFGFVDTLQYFQPRISKIRDEILAMDIEGLTYLQRIEKISAAEAIQIEEQIKLSQTLGEPYTKTAARIRKINDIGRTSAFRLAHMASMTASNIAHIRTYEQSKVVKGWIWSATLDSRTCPICGMRDGEKYKFEQVSLIPAHFFCRCSPVPFIDPVELKKLDTENTYKDEQGTRIARNPDTGTNYKVPEDTTWRDWFRDQTPDVQKGIIGKGRYELYSQNKITLNQIVPRPNTRSNSPIVTLKQLRKIAEKKA